MNHWMHKKLAIGLVGLGLWSSSYSPSLADDHKVSVPKETKFVIHLDIDAFRNTELGGMLFKMAREKAKEAIAENGGEEAPDLEKIEEMLGFDPFEELRGITIASSDYENPEKSMMAVVELGKNSGNIEGLVLGLPAMNPRSIASIKSIRPRQRTERRFTERSTAVSPAINRSCYPPRNPRSLSCSIIWMEKVARTILTARSR